ncbi:GNAT family N-acetyltransferase [Dermacoccaceae bacterium W4C1]
MTFALPLEQVTLTGRLVRLEPLRADHAPALAQASADGDVWDRWYTSVVHPDDMAEQVATRIAQRESGFLLPFVAVRCSDEVVLGMTTFYDITPAVPRVSVGYTWNRASAHGSGTNPESKLLLMQYAFETLGVRCVRYETSWSNQQSRQAIEGLGARLDGVLRADRLERGGQLRDTVVYSVMSHEWPSVRATLEHRLRHR